MAEAHFDVTARSVFKTFKHVAPCTCHKDRLDEPLKYNVETTTDSTFVVGRGPLIKTIWVECKACGREKVTDVENCRVHEREFNPY